MDTFLKDGEIVSLSKENYKEFFQEQKKTDVWENPYINELNVKGVINAPVLKEQIKTDLGIEVDDEILVSCMETTKLALTAPISGRMQVVPIRDTAFEGVCDRAGVKGPALSCFQDKARQKEMPPEDKAIILNYGLSCYPLTKALVLLRDGKITAVHSGDESDYSVLPVSDLISKVEESLDFYYPNWSFVSASSSHSFVRVDYLFNDDKLTEDIAKTLGKNSEFLPSLIFSTSDTGNSSAKLYLALRSKSSFPMIIGKPQCLTHKNNSNVEMFSEKCDALTASMRDNIALVKALTKKNVEHVGGAIRALANKLRLPKKFSLKIASDYEDGYAGKKVSFYDVFLALQDIIYTYESDAKNVTPEKVFELSESVASMLYFENLSDYDRVFEWAE